MPKPCIHTDTIVLYVMHIRRPHPLPSLVGLRVCDAGCGTGLFLPLLARAVGRRGHVVGIDPSDGTNAPMITMRLIWR